MTEIKRYRPDNQPSTTGAFSSTKARQEPVLLSFKNLQAHEIVDIAETSV